MDWDDLKYFLAVYRAGSSAAAARRLGVRHSTVGRRLAALEAALDARLFLRASHGLTATDAARAIVASVETIEHCVAGIGQTARNCDRSIEGKVRVTTSEAFAGYLFSRLPRLRAVHPLLRVELLAGNRVFDLQTGEADIAVRMVPTEQADLVCRVLVPASWSLYASRDYLAAAGRPASLDDLARFDIIGFDQSMAGSPGAQWLADHALPTSVPLAGNSVGTLVQAADAGAGIAMIPCFLAHGRANLVRLFDDLAVDRNIWIVFRKDVGQVARVRAVIDFLADTIVADRPLFERTASAVSNQDSPHPHTADN